MDGSYLSKEKQIVGYLKVWTDNVINNELWKNFIDLHIDDIIKDFQDKKNWLNGSLFVFNCLTNIVDKSDYDIVLVIPLSCSLTESKTQFSTLKEIENELDITPPSFYLFPKDYKNFKETIKSAQLLYNLSKELNAYVYYKEERESEEIYRTIYII